MTEEHEDSYERALEELIEAQKGLIAAQRKLNGKIAQMVLLALALGVIWGLIAGQVLSHYL